MMAGNDASPAMHKYAAAETSAAVKATLRAIAERTVPCQNGLPRSKSFNKAKPNTNKEKPQCHRT